MRFADATRNSAATAIDGDHIDRGDPVDREAIHARERAVTSAGDVAARRDGVAIPAGNATIFGFEQLLIGASQLNSGAEGVGCTARRREANPVQRAHVQNGAVGIVHDEVFVAVTGRAHGGTKTGIQRLLQRARHVFRVLAICHAADQLRLR